MITVRRSNKRHYVLRGEQKVWLTFDPRSLPPLTHAPDPQFGTLKLFNEERFPSSAAIAMVPRWDAAGASGALVAGAAVTAVVGAVASSDVIRVRETAAALAASVVLVVLALLT